MSDDDEMFRNTVFAEIHEQGDEYNALKLQREGGTGHMHIQSDGTRVNLTAAIGSEAPGEGGDQTTVGVDLTPTSAREVADALLEAADQADLGESGDALLYNEEP